MNYIADNLTWQLVVIVCFIFACITAAHWIDEHYKRRR